MFDGPQGGDPDATLLAQVAERVPLEGDEIAAAQALIEQLGLSGILFTADALHCQKNLRRRGRDRQRAAGAGQGQPATLA